ncbi:MAG: glycosyltransferase, partial [Chloroflexota bacterium]|nr:glycosyltransferase [Chloroflexota bacterium]
MHKNNSTKERQKWDAYYASLDEIAEREEILQFRDELVDKIEALLPSGGRILEAGCGAGEQSLALARIPGFDITLLDFSSQALERARQAFAHENLTAEFILADAFTPGDPEFDLVFNAGVLEHYAFDQQLDFLRGMASRSKKYVLALVPNPRNYWYWIWRVHKTSRCLWPFGKEVPSLYLSNAFEATGLHHLGNRFLGETWTQSFITGIDGISEDLRNLLIKVHKSGLLPADQTSYLVAALGSVEPSPRPQGWSGNDGWQDSTDAETITAALADALALQVSAAREAEQLRGEIGSKIADTLVRVQRLEQTNTAELIEKVRQIERQSAAELIDKTQAIERKRALELIEKVRQIERENTAALINKEQEAQHLRAQVAALSQPPPTLRQRIQAFWGAILSKLHQHPRLTWLKRIYKRLRHTFQKQVSQTATHTEQVFAAPISLGHPQIAPGRRVVILTYTFFDFNGNNMYSGGAERYVLELVNIIRSLGFYPEIYQCGNGFWVRYYQNLRITGIDVGGDAARLPAEFQKLEHQEALIIYSPFSVAHFPDKTPSIGISHGVYWDHPSFQVSPAPAQKVLQACQNLDTVVSVDTNTINWLRATSVPLAEKLIYLPNFVDVEKFEPSQPPDDSKIVILYPRRLYRPRGFWLVAEILAEILDHYPRVEFYFVGKAEPPEEERVNELMTQYPGRVCWDSLPPEQMPKAYQRAHITIIPTVHSEGTSLSCLEALASGNAVIATNVGGLPNIILPGHNGLLIEPSADALKQAIKNLIEDKNLRDKLGRNGREVAMSFSLKKWRARWQEILTQFLPASVDETFSRLPTAFFPAAPGITWEGIKQRPHHLAQQLAQAGIETFWQNPTGRQPSPHPLLHIVSPNDEVCIQRPIVLIYYPFTYRDLEQYDNPYVIYDVLDDISIHAASDRESGLPVGSRAVDYHRKLLAEADVVTTSSSVLYQRLKPIRPDVILIPNGVDLSHFRKPHPRESDRRLTSKRKPVIGFHGAIAEWFDIELFRQVARM